MPGRDPDRQRGAVARGEVGQGTEHLALDDVCRRVEIVERGQRRGQRVLQPHLDG
ncbi:hypothetical protein [Actinophytocola sp.]|uniref:hypothetical protein n=1 Tax=Actinophytocola sp. TaxID=1872138 RepID=UPI002D60AC0C|nr:hypothetical protein [Actinophytocola sp.]HYQ65211.1 hypothetical protein [Actinophytocola sp.]